MSTPLSQLKKVRKSPLPRDYSVPFRDGQGEDILDAVAALDSVTHKYIVDDIRKQARVHKRHDTDAPRDADLVASMASRLAVVERELLSAKREIVEKDNIIRRLMADSSHPCSEGELEAKCAALQRQVDEMEEFLNDYGMMWVGSDCAADEDESVWRQESSVVTGQFDCDLGIDFDRIVRNIRELNLLAGESSAQVRRTTNGAVLRPPDPVPLTLFKNGMVMFGGPFRPYTDHSTQRCVQDLMDGYFPSELQHQFPDGVPFNLRDCRSKLFKPRRMFPGEGQTLQGQDQICSLPQQSDRGGAHTYLKSTSELPVHRVSVDAFLAKLPSCVMRGGRVVDIRSGVSEALHGKGSKMTVVVTPVVQELKQRLESEVEERPPTPGRLVTLRVKSETGDETYVLKMRYSDTIGDIRRQINTLRAAQCDNNYWIKSSYPRKTYSDDSASLGSCGLFPTANLFLTSCSNHDPLST